MLKLTGCEVHAMQRARERQGVPLTNALKHRLVREIKRAIRRAPGLDRGDLVAWATERPRNDGRQGWRVTIEGREWHVVYQTRERIIVTVLPLVYGRARNAGAVEWYAR